MQGVDISGFIVSTINWYVAHIIETSGFFALCGAAHQTLERHLGNLERLPLSRLIEKSLLFGSSAIITLFIATMFDKNLLQSFSDIRYYLVVPALAMTYFLIESLNEK